MKLSAVILTKNEEHSIQQAIESLIFCDEIIVIDDFSDDKTLDIVNKYNCKVYKKAIDSDFGAQRNFGIEKSKNEWVLFLDADEVVTNELANEIQTAISENTDKIAYYIKRRDYWWGRELKYGEIQKVRNRGLIRLIKKGSGSWKGKVHEEFMTTNPVGHLDSYINHFPHPKVADFLREVNFYSTIRAKELQNKDKKGSILEILFIPPSKFYFNYILRLGFLDGPAGFAYAFIMSFHSFLVRAKLYQYTRIDNKK